MPLFDIVIPTYNNLEELKTCLKCFAHQTIKDFRIWVAVDGSTDGTLEYLSTHKFDFLLNYLEHSNKKNQGRAAARNLVLPHLTAVYVLFLDSDLTVLNTYLEMHLNVLSGDEVISLGQIQYQNANIWGQYDMTRGMNQFVDLSVLPAKYMVTGNVAMPSRIFRELKGFDEAINTYGGEDTEFGCRVQERFHSKVLFNKKAVAYGIMNKTLDFALQQREIFAGQGLKYLLNKHPEASDIFRINFLQSKPGKILYTLIPGKLLLRAGKSSWLPLYLRLKIIHLLVFYHIYKGYNC